jgi:hypothetical protein
MKTRDQIITSMCHTWRHDYGITKDWPNNEASYTSILTSGMTKVERESLWRQMAQIFDNDIAPHMEFKAVATSRNTCGND